MLFLKKDTCYLYDEHRMSYTYHPIGSYNAPLQRNEVVMFTIDFMNHVTWRYYEMRLGRKQVTITT